MPHDREPTFRTTPDPAARPGTCRVRCQFPYVVARPAVNMRPIGERGLRVEPWVPQSRRGSSAGREASPHQALRMGAVGLASAALVGCAGVPTQASGPQPLSVAPVLRMDGGAWTPDGAYLAGRDALSNGRVHEALVLFERAAILRPHFDDAINGKVIALARLGRTADAIVLARAAVGGGSLSAELHGNLGLLLMRSGRSAEAWPVLERAARLDPDNATWTLALARRSAVQAPAVADAVPVQAVATAPPVAAEPAAVAGVAPATEPAALPTQAAAARSPEAAAAPAATDVAAAGQRAEIAASTPVAPQVALAVPAAVPLSAPVAAPLSAPVATPLSALITKPVVAPITTPVVAPDDAPATAQVALAAVAAVAEAKGADRQPETLPKAPTVAIASPRLRWDHSQANVLQLKMDNAPAVAVAPPTPEAPKPVQLAEAAQATPKLRFTIEVSNGAGTPGLAKATSSQLRTAGVQPWRITNHSNYKVAQTEVQYRRAEDAVAAGQLARKLGVTVALVQNPHLHASVNLRVVLGKDVAALQPGKRVIAELQDGEDGRIG